MEGVFLEFNDGQHSLALDKRRRPIGISKVPLENFTAAVVLV